MSAEQTPSNAACDNRCKPPCEQCLADARLIARGAISPRMLGHRKWPLVSLVVAFFACLALSAYLRSPLMRSSGAARFSLLPCAATPFVLIAIAVASSRSKTVREGRVRSGQCAWCGYDLLEIEPAPPTPPAVSGDDLRLVECPECGRWNARQRRFVIVHADLDPWPSKERLAEIMREARLTPMMGRHSVRIAECAGFTFQSLGSDLAPPYVDGAVATVRQSVIEARTVAVALARAGIRHRFELYEETEPGTPRKLIGYLHHNWPSSDAPAEVPAGRSMQQ